LGQRTGKGKSYDGGDDDIILMLKAFNAFNDPSCNRSVRDETVPTLKASVPERYVFFPLQSVLNVAVLLLD